MSVYATGRIIYGFVHDDDTAELFAAIVKKFDEKNEDEEEYGVQLYSVGYANVDIIAACDASASAKSFDCQVVPAEYFTQTTLYDQKIAAFLTALDIDPTKYQPQWHILGYMW